MLILRPFTVTASVGEERGWRGEEKKNIWERNDVIIPLCHLLTHYAVVFLNMDFNEGLFSFNKPLLSRNNGLDVSDIKERL